MVATCLHINTRLQLRAESYRPNDARRAENGANVAEIKCDQCKGKGHFTKTIAGDVHIAECPDCSGWGSITVTKDTVSRYPAKLKKFGSVNINDLLDERLESLTPTLTE
jgi:DnaJ-class molecular chaperone